MIACSAKVECLFTLSLVTLYAIMPWYIYAVILSYFMLGGRSSLLSFCQLSLNKMLFIAPFFYTTSLNHSLHLSIKSWGENAIIKAIL